MPRLLSGASNLAPATGDNSAGAFHCGGQRARLATSGEEARSLPPWFGAEQLWQIGDIGGAALRRGEQLLRPARRALEAEWQNGHTSA